MTSSCRSFKTQHKEMIKLILDRNSEATQEKADKTVEEEDDMTEQAPVLPHQGLYQLAERCPRQYR
jgi:hypothetical protein